MFSKSVKYIPVQLSAKVSSVARCLRTSSLCKAVTECRNIYTDTAPSTCEDACHIPVMLHETVDLLQPKDGQVLIDMTFGAGGHSKEILRRASVHKLFVLDRDPMAHDLAQNLAKQHHQVVPLLGKFSDLAGLMRSHGVEEGSVDGVLFDVGVSSMQFDQAQRGFMLSQDGPLDMRMDGNRNMDQITAADVVNILEESALLQIIKKYGEDKQAKKIARTIVESRYAFGKITTTKQLADVVASAFHGQSQTDRLGRSSHPATRTFQALRIFVNNELNELYNGLEMAYKFLKQGGRCAAITFHSLEDRIVKRIFHGIDMDEKFNMSAVGQHRNSAKIHTAEEVEVFFENKWAPITKRVVMQNFDDNKDNPRGRSAKLRAAMKL